MAVIYVVMSLAVSVALTATRARGSAIDLFSDKASSADVTAATQRLGPEAKEKSPFLSPWWPDPKSPLLFPEERWTASQILGIGTVQRRRLKTKEPEDDQFLFRIWADLQFLIVSLTRLRRSVGLAMKIPSIKTVIHEALADFDKALR